MDLLLICGKGLTDCNSNVGNSVDVKGHINKIDVTKYGFKKPIFQEVFGRLLHACCE